MASTDPGFIYSISYDEPIDGKYMVYVGLTIEEHAMVRADEHLDGTQTIVGRWMNWLGVVHFTISVLESFETRKEGRRLELEYMRSLNTVWPNGLNFECGDGEAAALSRASRHSAWVRRKVKNCGFPPYPAGGTITRDCPSISEASLEEWSCFRKYLEELGIECKPDFAYVAEAKRRGIPIPDFGYKYVDYPFLAKKYRDACKNDDTICFSASCSDEGITVSVSAPPERGVAREPCP